MSSPSTMPSGWFPDPHGRYEHRWFNGTAWTADVADDGQRFIDPMGAAPAPRYEPSVQGQTAKNGIATAAMVCGLIGAVTAWIPLVVVFGGVLSILGVVFGIVGVRRARTRGRGKGFAITGLVSGIVGVLLSIVGVWLTVDVVREFTAYLEPGPHQIELVSCEVADGQLRIEGELTNASSRVRDYVVFGVVLTPGSVRDLVIEVDDVPAGETVPIEMSRPVSAAGPCVARLVVQGPFPYDTQLERMTE